jgi:hypothetical protein
MSSTLTWIADDSKLGTLSQTAYNLRFSPPRITVIRRYHPLEGEQFDVLAERGRCLDVRLEDGTTMRIPREWTNADGLPPEQHTPDAVFTVSSFRELIEIVDALRERT